MGEPMGLQAMFFGTMAGAGVVLTGALYALFFALARLHSNRTMGGASLACYLLLVFCVYVLADALALSGFWIVVTAVMLAGYFLLPRAIWHLCVGTHAADAAASQSRATQ